MIGTAKSILSYAPRGESLSGLVGGEKERASARAPAIALFGLFGCGNFGNDGSLEAMLNLLRRVRPDAQLACICANPGLIQDRFDVNSLPISAAHVADTQNPRGGRARKLLEKLHDAL